MKMTMKTFSDFIKQYKKETKQTFLLTEIFGISDSSN